ncbi:hypothetical protein TSH7_09800 [Azospirillum sp. TSH7]|nr:hypothetical protein TSH20_18895 [Azospirillum sp. TSH20]PWC64828.1 hypothetical protein TSH7_09800 [Azospirillum sp. TSH7]
MEVHAKAVTASLVGDMAFALEHHARLLADEQVQDYRVRVQHMLLDHRDAQPTGSILWRLHDELAKELGALPRREQKTVAPSAPAEAKLRRIGQLRLSA